MIDECISTVSYSILVNGSPCGFFKSTRGLLQGDPLSPALFTFLTDLLSRLLARDEAHGKITGVKVSSCSPRISHLMYADDLVIYCQASIAEASEVLSCLNTYCSWTGQTINLDKSSIHFSANTPAPTKATICNLMHIPECSHNGTYLANPLCRFQSKSVAFQPLIDKLARKLAGWK